MSKEKYLLIGAHMSIAGGLHKAIERAKSIGCTTMQIFTKSNRSWLGRKITDKEAEQFKKSLKSSGLAKIMVHASYLINLAAKTPAMQKKSITALKEELKRCEKLGIKYLVLHPGSHVGVGEEEGIKKIAKGLDKVFEKCPGKAMVLLETTAGQGTNLGYTFQQLRAIYKLSKNKKRIGVCLDTCHIFAAGYDIRTEKEFKATLKQFEEELGLKHLKAIHLNDSKTALGARLDRHEKIGKGKIKLPAFRLIMKDKRLKNIPKVLETPIKKDPLKEYGAEITLLKNEKE